MATPTPSSSRSNSMRLRLVAPILLLALSSLSLALCSGVKLYVMGDSLVDIGNANFFKNNPGQFATANFAPYGQNLTPPRPTGRFSNGRLFPDFLAAQMGIETPPPFLTLDNETIASPNGINFAVAGAGALAATKLSVINMYSEMEWVVAALGKTVTTAASRNALATQSIALLSIGGNDFFSFFLRTLPAFYRNGSPAIAAGIVSATLTSIQRLYNLGLRNFVVLNVGPLGCVPVYRNIMFWNFGCSSVGNNAAMQHNNLLDRLLPDLQSKLPDANIVVVDTYTSFYDAASALGISPSKGACCGYPSPTNGLQQCGTGRATVCKNPSQYMFWDYVHPGETAVQRIFNLAWSGPTRNVRPYNLATLFNKMNISPPIKK